MQMWLSLTHGSVWARKKKKQQDSNLFQASKLTLRWALIVNEVNVKSCIFADWLVMFLHVWGWRILTALADGFFKLILKVIIFFTFITCKVTTNSAYYRMSTSLNFILLLVDVSCQGRGCFPPLPATETLRGERWSVSFWQVIGLAGGRKQEVDYNGKLDQLVWRLLMEVLFSCD